MFELKIVVRLEFDSNFSYIFHLFNYEVRILIYYNFWNQPQQNSYWQTQVNWDWRRQHITEETTTTTIWRHWRWRWRKTSKIRLLILLMSSRIDGGWMFPVYVASDAHTHTRFGQCGVILTRKATKVWNSPIYSNIFAWAFGQGFFWTVVYRQ